MPVHDLWLDPGLRDVSAASELLKPLRCSADAALPHELADKSCGERLRGHPKPANEGHLKTGQRE
jgi:hypothetical protein